MPDTPIIELRQVHKSFGPLTVLDGVDLAIRRGATTVVIGPSGCGKSVLLKHIVVLLRPDSGQVFFDGQEISEKLWQQKAIKSGPLACSTPAVSDGRIVLRLRNAVACYDLRP